MDSPINPQSYHKISHNTHIIYCLRQSIEQHINNENKQIKQNEVRYEQ